MITDNLKTPNVEYKEASTFSLFSPASSALTPATSTCTLQRISTSLTTMMFFKTAFALYLAAMIALAAPPPNDQGLVEEIRTFGLNPLACLLCTSLSTVDISVNDLEYVAENSDLISNPP